MDYLCGATIGTNPDPNSTTVGINIKTEPTQSILSPPITPPESMVTDDDCTSSFSFADYFAKATPEQEQSMLSLLQPQMAVKQEEKCNVNQTPATVLGQNTFTQQLLNLLHGQKTQQGLPAMHDKSLEQLLQEPSILASASRPRTAVTSQQTPVTQQQSLVTQQVEQVILFTSYCIGCGHATF